jgi:alkylation response protein AidB-like acyl-CoA dehydrogenase
MSHYRSNVRDIEFNLFEVLAKETRLGVGPFSEMDAEMARQVLTELNKVATGPIAASFTDADRHPPVFDPATHSVRVPESFKRSYQAMIDGDWFRLEAPASAGGFGAPPSLRWGAAELILGANPGIFLYSSGPGMARVLDQLGTPEQQKIASHLVERHWGSTMVLTEPDAGSDVGAGRTKAVRQPDGTWHVMGVKRFITSGDQDMTENILHFVLARPEGEGIMPKPGTKGLSLFVVPKYLFDWSTGEVGERNGVFVTGLEHKMGLKVSSTCELSFGLDGIPAVGYLLGEAHDGIAQMFHVIEYARMLVGTKAIATLSTGYLNALEYAKQRVQGADLTRMADKDAPRVTILHHPDVRRMLLRQKAYAEGLRALYLYTGTWQDRVAADSGDVDDARRVNDLLLPVVKGVGSERAYENLALALQVLGGSGYTQDYPIEQYLRDAKIDTLYEGTTAIQAQDFFFRKIVKDQGVALAVLATEIETFLRAGSTSAASDSVSEPSATPSVSGASSLTGDFTLLGRALQDFQQMVASMVGYTLQSASHPRSVYKVGEHAVTLLMSAGDLLLGYLLLRQAVVAQEALDAGAAGKDADFYIGKVASAHWFTHNVLPELAARRAIVAAADLSLMDVPEASF